MFGIFYQIERFFVIVLFLFVATFFAPVASGTDYNSSNFIIRDPVVTIHGGRSVATDLQLFDSSGGIVSGQSSSANFILRSGFLYFPVVSTPSLSATVTGNTEILLSWSVGLGQLGWNISQYQVGRATVSGGPYLFRSVGNVLSYTETGLTNGTSYHFVVTGLDAFGNVIVTSTQVTATPTSDTVVGSGSGGPPSTAPVVITIPSPPPPLPPGTPEEEELPPETTFIIQGYGPPESTLRVLQDGLLLQTMTTNADGTFTMIVTDADPGVHVFSLFAIDEEGRQTSALTMSVDIVAESSTQVTQVVLPPTMEVTETTVDAGELIVVRGSGVPQSQIVFGLFFGRSPRFSTTTADATGNYIYYLETNLTPGAYQLQVQTAISTPERVLVSSRSERVDLVVASPVLRGRADLDIDGTVDIVDFSILLLWYHEQAVGRTPPDRPAKSPDLNGDGRFTLIDFSIMAFYWTR